MRLLRLAASESRCGEGGNSRPLAYHTFVDGCPLGQVHIAKEPLLAPASGVTTVTRVPDSEARIPRPACLGTVTSPPLLSQSLRENEQHNKPREHPRTSK